MEIKILPLGDIAINCYLILTDKTAIVIDPGFYSEITESFLKENEGKERIILLTHSHFDHIGGAETLRDKTGVKIAIGEKEAPFLTDSRMNLSSLFGIPLIPFSADVLLTDRQVLNIGDVEIKVLHTPGHTLGSVSYLINDVLFSGDTLFYESIGRTDFPSGDFNTLADSIKRLYTLSGNTEVFAGHGPKTTIAHEKQYNPFVR